MQGRAKVNFEARTGLRNKGSSGFALSTVTLRLKVDSESRMRRVRPSANLNEVYTSSCFTRLIC